MIIDKTWVYFHRKSVGGNRYSVWRGIFLFGFIPLYLKRIDKVVK